MLIGITKRFKTIRYELGILKSLEEPATLYDILKRTHIPQSSIHLILCHYLSKGIIKVVREEPTRVKRYMKKYYQLTDSGYLLLKLAKMLERQ